MLRRNSTTRAYFDGPNRYVREKPGSTTIVEADASEVRWATKTYISSGFLDWCAEGRKANRRAPLGDRHGAWQKVAEIPLALLFDKLPPDAWEDRKALAKIVNDPDLKKFRTDGDHRRF